MSFSKQSVVSTTIDDIKLMGKIVPAKEVALRKRIASAMTTINHWNLLPYDAATYTASNGSVYSLNGVRVFSGFAPFVLPASVTISGNPRRETDLLKRESIFTEEAIKVDEEKREKPGAKEGKDKGEKSFETVDVMWEGEILSPEEMDETIVAMFSALRVKLEDTHFRNLMDLRTNCALSDVRERLLNDGSVPVGFPVGSMPIQLNGGVLYYKDSGTNLAMDDVFNDWSDQLKKMFQ